jgi:phosphopentomutase
MRSIIIVLDSLGVGELPDAANFGDQGANTLKHIAEATNGLNLPNLYTLGLGNITSIKGVPHNYKPIGSYGKANEKSNGKDTTVGHWEMAGLITTESFPTYPNGFPKEFITELEEKTGFPIIGNVVGSGTDIINAYSEEQIKSKSLIIYTSADSVLQIAAHEEIISLDELYRCCEIAKELSDVSRVIARPYIGEKGNYTRTPNRRDYSVKPTSETMLDRISKKMDVIGVGKISDIFAGVGITKSIKTVSNNDGMVKTIELIKEENTGLIFTNLVDFDMKYGHRRDPVGYKNALEEFDTQLGDLIKELKDDDLLILTADHGCDPTFPGNDHTREYIPIITYQKNTKGKNLGVKESFTAIAKLVESHLKTTIK